VVEVRDGGVQHEVWGAEWAAEAQGGQFGGAELVGEGELGCGDGLAVGMHEIRVVVVVFGARGKQPWWRCSENGVVGVWVCREHGGSLQVNVTPTIMTSGTTSVTHVTGVVVHRVQMFVVKKKRKKEQKKRKRRETTEKKRRKKESQKTE
jgi:hypothetical protein